MVFVRRSFLMGLMCVLPGLARVSAQEETSLSEAIRIFAREKSAAEQYGTLLATVGKSRPDIYVHGIELYADAKAEFDGLLAELKFDLASGRDPETSEKFTKALQSAAEKRIAFTSYVSREIVDRVHGAKPGLPDALNAVPELIKTLTDAGLSIWKAFRDTGKDRRDAILNELRQLEWRSFGELVKT